MYEGEHFLNAPTKQIVEKKKKVYFFFEFHLIELC